MPRFPRLRHEVISNTFFGQVHIRSTLHDTGYLWTQHPGYPQRHFVPAAATLGAQNKRVLLVHVLIGYLDIILGTTVTFPGRTKRHRRSIPWLRRTFRWTDAFDNLEPKYSIMDTLKTVPP